MPPIVCFVVSFGVVLLVVSIFVWFWAGLIPWKGCLRMALSLVLFVCFNLFVWGALFLGFLKCVFAILETQECIRTAANDIYTHTHTPRKKQNRLYSQTTQKNAQSPVMSSVFFSLFGGGGGCLDKKSRWDRW